MKVHGGTPAEWFDQFPPLEKAAEWPAGSQWCPRHWAPCPVMGANGIGAATELMQIFISEIAPPNAKSAEMMNREMAKVSPFCCYLGDDRIFQLWGHWPPSQPQQDTS